jgi:uncharacterized protein involved in exopolysaccharide biosynthesis
MARRVTDRGRAGGMPPGPVTLRGFLAVAAERRRGLILFIGAVAVVSGAVSLLLPKWYTAESTILPPTETTDGLDPTSALIENSALNRLGLFTSSTPSDVYVEILKSRRLRESLIQAFDLQHLYKLKGMDRTAKELGQHVKISSTPIGVVSVKVEDRDPRRAADMANRLVADLDRFNRESVNTRAKYTREFLEKRLTEIRASLQQAESTLTAYEQKNKVVASSEQTAVGAMADVISQKLNLEVRRSYLMSYTREGSAALREVEAEIAAMDRELGKLPSLKQEGSRLALDAEIQRRIFTLVTARYEETRVQEARDTPTLTVLDPARAPEVRSRPRRTVIVLVSILAAAVLAAAWVLVSMRGQARA